MTTKKKKKTTIDLADLFGKKKKKAPKAFMGMAAPDRWIYTWQNEKRKFNWHVLAKNNEVVCGSVQGHNNAADMVNELYRLWPHLAIKVPDTDGINDA